MLLLTALAGAGPLSAQAPPASDIWLVDVTVRGGRVRLGTPVNVTARPGYDNQPAFLPDGRSILIVDGILRARYRDSASEPSLIDPGRVYRYDVDLWATSNVFKAGHRLRVSVASSNFPRWNRNLNSAESPETGTEIRTAVNTVFFDAPRPSHVLLPVIPTQP